MWALQWVLGLAGQSVEALKEERLVVLWGRELAEAERALEAE